MTNKKEMKRIMKGLDMIPLSEISYNNLETEIQIIDGSACFKGEYNKNQLLKRNSVMLELIYRELTNKEGHK